jgi:hypothetical protein
MKIQVSSDNFCKGCVGENDRDLCKSMEICTETNSDGYITKSFIFMELNYEKIS